MPGFVRRWQTELGDTYVLGLARVAFGLMLFWQALGWAKELSADGYFGDAFHVPILPESLVPSRLVYTALVATLLVLAALVTVGHRARGALLASALLGLYVLLSNRLEIHHNRYALLCFAGLLSFSPCDRSFVITGAPPGDGARVGPLWAQRLAEVQLSIIYLASGGSKLLDVDWRDGLVLGDRIARYGGQAVARGVPPAVVELLAQPLAASALAKAAIATELFLALGLWGKRTRVFALWWGVLFHITIELTSKVEQFTWISFAAYALFVTPDVHARKLFFDPSRPKGILYARVVGALDWLARFEVRPWTPDALKGHSIVVVRRDGSRATGVRALAMVARCVPLLFPLWGPLALVASFTKGGEASTRV
jgi:vitamin K-dependent gamma-carboxylase-like protein